MGADAMSDALPPDVGSVPAPAQAAPAPAPSAQAHVRAGDVRAAEARMDDGRPEGRGSSRFPEATRDTARPEGGGRAASGSHPAPARQWPLLTVLGGVGLGLAITAAGAFRVGLIVIGLFMLVGGAMRWLLPSVGMLAVRSRFTDLITYGVAGLAIIMLALMVQPNPILHFPFLDDVVHVIVSRG